MRRPDRDRSKTIVFGAAGRAAGMGLGIVLATGGQALAQTPAEFYAGKNMEMVIGYSVGASYDFNGRIVARHIGKYIPGKPQVIVRNMPGAGSLVSTNHLYNAAAKDGTVIGIFSRGNPMYPLLESGAKFDAAKLNWIGSTSKEVSFVVASAKSPFKTLEDVQRNEMLVGGTGAGADTVVFPAVLNGTIGTRLKIVSGYPGIAEIMLALERGEVQGSGSMSLGTIRTARPQWLKDGSVNFLAVMALQHHATELRNVPLASNFAKNPIDRQALELILSRQSMAYPVAAPPGVPADRVAALRAAFMAMAKDKEFVAEAIKAGFDIDPVSGEEIAAIITKVYAAPKEAIERARAAVAAGISSKKK